MKHEESVLRFTRDPDVRFTNDASEQKFRMAKFKMKVSGFFRTRFYSEDWCRISSYLSSVAVLGYNPLVAIRVALAGRAADMIKMHHPTKGVSNYGSLCMDTINFLQPPMNLLTNPYAPGTSREGRANNGCG